MKSRNVSRRFKVVSILLLLFLFLLAGCSPKKEADKPLLDEQSLANTGTSKKDEQGEEVKEPEVISVTITAVGDVTLGINTKMTYPGSFDEYYDKYGPSYFFENVKDIFENDDFTLINLEGPLTNSNDRQNKLFNHRGKPEYVNILKEGSIEGVSLSNNHTLDYGYSGYQDTMDNLSKAGISWASEEHYGIYETKGIKIGFISIDEHYNGPLAEAWLESGIKKLREEGVDITIASPHWGSAESENTTRVDDYQIELGKKCIDWGYDLVIGNHPHVLQGIDKYKGKYITYCLGNFSFGGSRNPRDKDCGIFQQTFTFIDGELQEDDNIRFIPTRTSSISNRNDYQPMVATGKEAQRIITKMNTLSAPYGISFDSDGYPSQVILTEKDKADAYFKVFLKSLDANKLENYIKYVGFDISSLNLSDTSYLEGLFKSWGEKSGFEILVGSKSQLVEAQYNVYANKRIGRIFIYEEAEWSNLQVRCRLSRLITMLNYIREDYTGAYADGTWEIQKGKHILLK